MGTGARKRCLAVNLDLGTEIVKEESMNLHVLRFFIPPRNVPFFGKDSRCFFFLYRKEANGRGQRAEVIGENGISFTVILQDTDTLANDIPYFEIEGVVHEH